MKGLLSLIGLGPGGRAQRTFQAEEALDRSEVIVGYYRYLALLGPRPLHQQILRSELTEEVHRAEQAIDLAADGKVVALVSSGDVGVYGMAGVVFEVLAKRGWQPGEHLDIAVIPGVSAGHAAAALLGAPLMHDFACISLSDLLTPWERVATRLDKAARADFVICLYNPASQRRTWQLKEAHRILLCHKSPQTPVGIVTNAYRQEQRITLTNLGQMLEHAIDMLTVVVIGNAETFVLGNRMVTPRGYPKD
jgi:cobalt-factor III methyltransferase